MTGSTMTEKILASRAGRDRVRPGDIVVVQVDTAVAVDLNFYDGMWAEPREVFDPDRIAIIYDHVVPAPTAQAAEYLARGRAFAERVGITQLHDVGPDQGICHQIIADRPYARPGELLVCTDSHTCSGGALNCAARGIGSTELIYVLAKGYTWFRVGETVRYEIDGTLSEGVNAKDVLLHIAGRFGDHVAMNIEFGGTGLGSLDLDERRTIATMCAEVSAEFAIFEHDHVLARHLSACGVTNTAPVTPDPDAIYHDVRRLDLTTIEPTVGLPGSVVNNTAAIGQVEQTTINRAFVGSCSNGTLADLRAVAATLREAKVHPDVTFLVTPGSQQIYQEALREGTIQTITEAGALITTSSCGMCAGFVNALSRGDVCISSSTRNFKGRMGHPDSQIYLGSSATVAASAVAGRIADPREVTSVVPA